MHGRAECNRRVWSLQHWAYRQLSIAFDAWRQCLVKAQKGDVKADASKATSTIEPLSVNTAVADKAVAGTKDTVGERPLSKLSLLL